MSSGRRTPPDIILLSRSDDTWQQFQGLNNVADIALQGQWQDDNYRALLWRLLLKLIPQETPPSRWGGEVAKKRDEYRRIKTEHRVDLTKVVDTNPMAANPLFSGAGDDPWRHFYERKEMTDTIKADLERLFPTGCGEYFLAPKRQQLLLSVLSLWADVHPATGYRQGMHEVLAPLVLVLEKEVAGASRLSTDGGFSGSPSETSSHKQRHAAAAMLDAGSSSSEDLEADAYWMFTAIMDGLEGFYEHKVDPTALPRGAGRGGGGGGGGATGGGDGEALDSPVVEMCKRVQGSRMKRVDPELQRHLVEMDISPQLYGMKWARLLFGREFRMENVLRLWDHILASAALEGRPDVPECVEIVAVSMVMSIRDQLLAEDSTGCLQLLMRFPPDQNVSTIINLSLALGQPGGGSVPASATISAISTASTAASAGGASNPDGYERSSPQQNIPHQRRVEHAAVSPCTIERRQSFPGNSAAESRPAWLIDGTGRTTDSSAGGGSGGSGGGMGAPRGSDVDSFMAERRGAGGVDVRGTVGTYSGGGMSGEYSHREGSGELRHNWQYGFDQFTRRAISAAQGVAKLAVQTVERSQGDAPRFRPDGISGAEASALARRLRAACSALEAGQGSSALQEMKQIAQALENGPQSSAGGGVATVATDDRFRVTAASTRNRSDVGSGGAVDGRIAARTFSTYSEDDGQSDGLYTRDM